jgi:hypothetical protein
MNAATISMVLCFGSVVAYSASGEIQGGDQGQTDAPPADRPLTMPEQADAPFVNFCAKELLHESGGKLFCNWGPSFAHACVAPWANAFVQKGAVIEGPDVVGTCDNGRTVVKIVNN